MPSREKTAQVSANKMSDHNALIDPNGGIVSQNLQGPYAIKKTGNRYVFDLPTKKPLNEKELSELTGISVQDCKTFLAAFIKQPNITSVERLLGTMKTKYPELNQPIGGGYRQCFETNEHYKQRMKEQITHLNQCIQGGTKILSLQEQPYDGRNDPRANIFNQVMNDAGYVRADNKVQGRDVGIWVKKGTTVKTPAQDFLQNLANTYRGCASIIDGCLLVNVHIEIKKGITPDEQTQKLIALKQLCEAEAAKQGVSLAITGDMNLNRMPDAKVAEFKKTGFCCEIQKGQYIKKKDGSDKFQEKNYEAYIPMYAPPQLQQQHGSSTAKMQKKLQANSSQTKPPSMSQTAQSFTPTAEINTIQKRLQAKNYQSFSDSIANKDKFKALNCYQYKATLHANFCVEGNLRTQGQSNIKVKGNWTDGDIQKFAEHIVNDLGWNKVNIHTKGEYGIPSDRVNAVVEAIRQQAKGKNIDVSIDGKKTENSSKAIPLTQANSQEKDETNTRAFTR